MMDFHGVLPRPVVNVGGGRRLAVNRGYRQKLLGLET
jgi:hypothetical protein